MCCGTGSYHVGSHHGYHHIGHHGWCAPSHCGPHVCGPHFMTDEQKTAGLEKYLEALRAEVKAVEERLAGMQEEM